MLGFGGLWLEYGRGRYNAAWGLGGCKYDRRNTAFLSIYTPQEMKAGGWEMQNIGGGSKHDVK